MWHGTGPTGVLVRMKVKKTDLFSLLREVMAFGVTIAAGRNLVSIPAMARRQDPV